jgi:SAM-dependent methyltransferase
MHVYAEAGERLVAVAALAPGESVCDVAAGTGAVTVPALRAVQPGGRVAAVDLSAGMLAQAEEAVGELAGASYHLAEADRLPFGDGSFDCVTCGLALPFFPDMRAAVAECRRVLRPTGRLAVSLFVGEPLAPALPLFVARLRRLLPPAATLPEDNGHVADAGRLAALMEASGFEPPRESLQEDEIVFESLGAWWEAAIASVHGAELARLAPRQRRDFEAEHRGELLPLTTPAEALVCRVAVRYAVARCRP